MNSSATLPNVIKLRTYKGGPVIDMMNVIRLEGNCNYTVFILKEGKKLLTSKTISYYEPLLPTEFIRVHKRCIINTEFLPIEDKMPLNCLQLSDGFTIPISRRRKNFVKDFINNKKTKHPS